MVPHAALLTLPVRHRMSVRFNNLFDIALRIDEDKLLERLLPCSAIGHGNNKHVSVFFFAAT